MTASLFDDPPQPAGPPEVLEPGAVVLRGFALAQATDLLAAVQQITAQAPFRHLVTPGGLTMSVAMTNCGALGWVSDRSGYRYDPIDPQTGQAWPAMPLLFRQLAREAAETAGFADFAPDACLINRYAPGTRLSCTRTATKATTPIPSCPCRWAFRRCFCGAARSGRTRPAALRCCTAMWWCGADRRACAFMECCPCPRRTTR